MEVRHALTLRLKDIPGVAGVVVDLDESSGGIHVRLEPGADEDAVLEKMRAVLVAYGLRPRDSDDLTVGRQVPASGPQPVRLPKDDELGVDIAITPIAGGARVLVYTKKVRSFRVVKPTPLAIAQGLADAWCQVASRIPFTIERVDLEDGELVVTASDGEVETTGRADVSEGWTAALPKAVGRAGGLLGAVPAPLAINS